MSWLFNPSSYGKERVSQLSQNYNNTGLSAKALLLLLLLSAYPAESVSQALINTKQDKLL